MNRQEKIRNFLACGCTVKHIMEEMPDTTYAEVRAVRREIKLASGITDGGRVRRRTYHADMLDKCAVRAAQLGMSYGVYMGSAEYRQDIAKGYYGKKKAVTAATVHGNE